MKVCNPTIRKSSFGCVFCAAMASFFSGCELAGTASVKPIIIRGAPLGALVSPEDIDRVAALVPAENSWINGNSSAVVNVIGTCITDSVATRVEVVAASISIRLMCNEITDEFSTTVDLTAIPDGSVTMSIEFLNNLVSTAPIYILQRTIIKDTVPPPTFSIPSNFFEENHTISFSADPVSQVSDQAALYRFTMTPVGGGAVVGPIESTTSSISVASLTVDTTYTVTVTKIDSAGNETPAANSGTFTKTDTDPPVFTSLPLSADALDGYINFAEKDGTSSLVGLPVASGQTLIQYGVGLSSIACSAMAFGPVPPTAASLPASDGNYKICVKLQDAAGNTTYGSAAMVRDTLAPVVTLTSTFPASPASTRRPRILGSVDSVSTVTLYNDLGCLTAISLDSNGTGAANAALASPGIAVTSDVNLNGTTNIYASATDLAGNRSSCTATPISFEHDDTFPVFTSLALAGVASDGYINNAEKTASSALANTLVASGNTSTDYAAGLSSVACSSMTFASVVPAASSLSSDGTYKVCVRLRDDAGNTTYGFTSSFQRDIVAPTVDAGGNLSISSASAATNNGASASGYSSLLWSNQSTGVGAITFSSASSLANTVLPDTNGTYTLRLTASDAAGNSASDDLTLTWSGLSGGGGSSGGSGSSITSLSLARITGNPGYMCAIVNGGVKCWGDGPLGDGNYDTVNGYFPSSPIPVTAITANSGVTDLALGPNHACSVAKGGLKCWGSDNQHQVGDSGANILDSSNNSGRTSPYQIIPENSGVTKVVLSAYFSCAIVDGGVQCWGGNWYGEAGYGITGASVPGDALDDWVDTPVTAIASGSGVTDLIASHYHVCALLGDKLKCWGRNDYGQIGNSRDNDGNVASPVTVISSGVSAFALGYLHTCAIVNGAVQCLGDNSRGQVGNSSSTAFLDSPTATSITSGATGLSLGPDYSCAVVNGGVKCWGSNSSGELGDGSTTDRNAPVDAIAASSGVTAVNATTIFHRSHNVATTCAIVSGGLKCWGSNPGVIENNPPTTSPVEVIGANSGVQSIVVSSNYSTLRYSCAGLSNSVRCWGNNGTGILGDGTTNSSVTPRIVNLSYASTTTDSAPDGRHKHTAIATSTEMIVWGGFGPTGMGDEVLQTGGRYNFATGTWSPTSTGTNVPSARINHTAVWTGSQMVVFGGWDNLASPTYFANGGRYLSAGDTWSAMSDTNAPSVRRDHISVWTGSKVIVWGGYGYDVGTNSYAYLSDGGLYDPALNTWTAMPAPPANFNGREGASYVWTGSKLIVWGGYGYNPDSSANEYLYDGSIYDPSANSWTSMGGTPPFARAWASGVWTGTNFIVWGGRYGAGSNDYYTDGRKYNLSTGIWTAISDAGAPEARTGQSTVWTGTEMLVYGGGAESTYTESGSAYNPSTDRWSLIGWGNGSSARDWATGVWDSINKQAYFWGGAEGSLYHNSGDIYSP